MDPTVKLLMENHKILNEMAVSWDEIKRSLVGTQGNLGGTRSVLEHLVKLYYWSHKRPGDINGWKRSVYSNCCHIPRWKKTNSYPKASKIYRVIWDTWGDTFDSIEKLLNKTYQDSDLPKISIGPDCIEMCNAYIKWLSHELSIDGAVSSTDVYKEIDKLMNIYHK